MVDLYLILLPIYSLAIVCTLVLIKRSLTNYVKIAKHSSTHIITTLIKNKQKQEALATTTSPLTNALKSLISNYTLAEMCFRRMAQNKIPLMLGLAISSILCSFSPNYYHCFYGALANIILIMGKFIEFRSKKTQKQQTNNSIILSNSKFLYLSLAIVSVAFNAGMLNILFKNYQNIFLQTMSLNILVNFSIDNIIVKPLTLIICAAITSKIEIFQMFLQHEEIGYQIICLTYSQLKQIQKESSKENSGIIAGNKLCLDQTIKYEPKNNSNKQNNFDSYEKAMQILKKIKKQRLPPLITPMKSCEGEFSQNSLFNSNRKQQKSPINKFNLDLKQFEEKVEEVELFEEKIKVNSKKSLKSENLILINTITQKEVNNEEDENYEGEKVSEERQQNMKQKTISDDKFSSKNETEPLRICMNQDATSSSGTVPLRICLNSSQCPDTFEPEEENQDSYSVRRKRSSQNEETTSNVNKNTIALLEIKEEKANCDDIEEIDLNSPEKRRHHQLQDKAETLREEMEVKIKKKNKKLSSDSRRRVIKYSTGEPYLQYLPNMLNKDQKVPSRMIILQNSKKSQLLNLSKKELMLEARNVNSVKRSKKIQFYEDNENVDPKDCQIEDL